MTDKKGYSVAPHPPTGFVPAPAQPGTYGVAGTASYGAFPNQPQLYATPGPSPAYEQTITHPMVYQSIYGQGYPGYLPSYPSGHGPFPYYSPPPPAAAFYPPAAMQPAYLRPAIMIPNSFDGMSQQVLPPAPPGVAANTAQLAAMAGHSVALSQKKGPFLGGGTEGGYAFW